MHSVQTGMIRQRPSPESGRRASHVLVKTEAEALEIKNEIASNKCDFAEAASKYSTCSSSARGGKLGKFAPGVMAKEFDDVVFSLVDTGKLNPVRTHVAKAAGAGLLPRACANTTDAACTTEQQWVESRAGPLAEKRGRALRAQVCGGRGAWACADQVRLAPDQDRDALHCRFRLPAQGRGCRGVVIRLESSGGDLVGQGPYEGVSLRR